MLGSSPPQNKCDSAIFCQQNGEQTAFSLKSTLGLVISPRNME
jgi:hypothetical protein